MVPRAFQALARQRAARARDLADRYPVSREGLLFFARVAVLQGCLSPTLKSLKANSALSEDVLAPLLAARPKLCELVQAVGPTPLRKASRTLDNAACHQSLLDCLSGLEITSPHSFFARVLLQPALYEEAAAVHGANQPVQRADGPERCPRCDHQPQAGSLRPQGNGTALHWTCSLCLHIWPAPRSRCPSCGRSGADAISRYSAPELDSFQLQACESCKVYIHAVDLAKEHQAIADVDELAALPLDVWARRAGYRKLRPNLIGI